MNRLTAQKGSVSESDLSEHKASPELVAEFSTRATKLSCTRKQILFQQGEASSGVYLIRAGEVILTMPISARRAMSFRAAEGSLVGLPATFSNESYSMAAVAERGCELEQMDREGFWQMLVAKPSLSLDVLQILAAETRSARIAIVELGSKRRMVRRKKG